MPTNDLRPIRRLLSAYRLRERAFSFAWALALSLAVAAGLFLAACGTDWLVDLYVDTPQWLRVGMLWAQAAAWTLAAVVVLAPFLRRISDDKAALAIEDKTPSLGHLLISAVQFDRDPAKTVGMSKELIDATTHEANRVAPGVDLGKVVDPSRVKKALAVLVPTLAAVGAFFGLAPELASILAARQFLSDDEIPRRVTFAAADSVVWPAGEENTLKVQAIGDIDDGSTGSVLVVPEGGSPMRLPLVFDEKTERGAVFAARVPPGDAPFTYHAWVGDGRLKTPGEGVYVSRPVIQTVAAWVQLPEKVVGKTAAGEPFEETQRGGDVAWRLSGSGMRLKVSAQVPIRECRVFFRTPGKPDHVESRLREEPAEEFDFVLPLDATWTGYEVSVTSADGFDNADRPRRSIRRLPLDPPDVALLGESQYRKDDPGSPDDYEVEGIPVVENRAFRVDYRAADRYGLSHARIRYRVIPRGASQDENANRPDRDTFLSLSLGVPRGGGANLTDAQRARLKGEFNAYASSPGGIPETEALGGYDFRIDGIPDGKGGLLRLTEGDRIQFYVEVYGKADPDGVPGRSAIREKEVVSLKALTNWLMRKDDLKERTRQLEEQQRNTRSGGEP